MTQHIVSVATMLYGVSQYAPVPSYPPGGAGELRSMTETLLHPWPRILVRGLLLSLLVISSLVIPLLVALSASAEIHPPVNIVGLMSARENFSRSAPIYRPTHAYTSY
jgi:hypothetical protein